MEAGPEDRLKGAIFIIYKPWHVPEGNGGWTRGEVKRDNIHYLQTLALYQARPENRLKGTIFIIYNP